ncbi:MAG: FHA domain-containing protein [Fimbriimonadaceae bacterium]|nr:FHA domain-containing protein [Fimbriimonadaceae bacterium]
MTFGLPLRFIVGAAAGMVAWAIMEPSSPRYGDAAWMQWESVIMYLHAALVGVAIGAMNGLQQGGRINLARSALLSLFFGMVGASVGSGIGSFVIGVLYAGQIENNPIARVIALTPIAAMLGAGIGGSSLNVKRMVQGLVGGAIAGAVGGILFDPIGVALGRLQITMNNVPAGQVTEVGDVSRAVYFTLSGALISLFIGLVDRLARSAWLRMELGRNEGREWSLDYAENFIGRSEGAQIPLFGDPNVAPAHAVIRREQGQYVLYDGGTAMGTGVNGHRIHSSVLRPGDVVQIGNFALQFQMRAGASPVKLPDHRVAGPHASASSGLFAAPASPGIPTQGNPTQGNPSQGIPTQGFPNPAAPIPNLAPTQAMPAANLQPTMAYAAAPVSTGFGLRVLDGPMAGQVIAINGPVELGRGSPQWPMAYDGQASRRHAQISPSPGGVMVQDLGSTNGTFVNGARIPTAEARPGDVIRIGGTNFRVEPV